MNELDLLNDLGQDLDASRPPASAALRARMLRGLTTPPPRRRRPAWQLALAGGLTTLVAIAATTAVLMQGADDPGPAGDPGLVLRNAALATGATGSAPPPAEAFIFTESVGRTTRQLQQRDGSFTTESGPPIRQQLWLSVDGHADGLLRQGPDGTSMWPDHTVLPGCTTDPSRCSTVIGFQPTLPDNPDAVPAWLAAGPADQMLVDRAVTLLTGGTYLTPRQRAAVFTTLSRQPGLHVIERATDAAGRTGIGVETPDGATLVFGRTSSVFLGTTTYALVQQAVVPAPGRLP